MKKVLLFLTVAFLCSSSSFSQARRQSQAKTAKTQQSYTKRVTSHTANWLVTLPNAKFSEANLQTLYNKAARIYAQKKHDRHFNGHEANEMLFVFCSSVDESQYNKDNEKVMDISPKDFASVVSPVFLQFLKLKRIQQPSTGKGWVKTVNASMKGITDPLEYLNSGSAADYREYAADVAFMKKMQTLLCAYFSVSMIHDPGVVNKFWKMYSTSEELLSNTNAAIYSCNGGGSMMSEITSDVSESYVANWSNFIGCLARVIDKDPTLKTDPIVTKYLNKDMNRIAGQATSVYNNWASNAEDLPDTESAKSDVDKALSSLRQLISDADDFANFSGNEQVYLNAYLMYFIDKYPRDVEKILSDI